MQRADNELMLPRNVTVSSSEVAAVAVGCADDLRDRGFDRQGFEKCPAVFKGLLFLFCAGAYMNGRKRNGFSWGENLKARSFAVISMFSGYRSCGRQR